MAKKKSTERALFADSTHQDVIGQFEEYANAVTSSGAQAMWQKCRNYRDGKQYTDEEISTLKKRKQPIITDNKIQDKCDTLLGIEKQMRTDPKCYPRNPTNQDEQSAEAATDALRFIADQSNFNVKVRKNASDNLMVEGMCAGQVIVEKRKGQHPKISMEHIHRDRVYYDVRSREDDFSDKTYCGYYTWLDEDRVLKDWPKAKEIIESSKADAGSLAGDESHDDKPRYISIAGKRARLQVFTHYHLKDGIWHESTWIRGGWLDEPRPCVYKDEYGEPTCCLELQALYRDAEGSPYGVVPRYLDLQDEHNKRRSKMLHLLNAKRIIASKGALQDENNSLNTARNEIHKPDGVIEVNGLLDSVRIEDNLKEAEGQWRLLQQTDIALSQTGPNSALGGTSGDISGVAKARDQQAGQLPISPLFDALDSWQLRMYRQAWMRVRQFWTAEMWVRVTDSEDKPKWVGLNETLTIGDRIAMAAKNDMQFQMLPPEEQQARIQAIAQDPNSMQQAIDDKTGRPLRKNDVAMMDIDIIIDRGQDVVTVQQEEFAQLAEIAKARPEIPFDVLVEMSQLRQTTKKRVMERLKGEGNDPMAAAKAMQQVQEQAAMLQQQAEALQAEAEQLQREKERVATDKVNLAVKSADLDVKQANIEKTEAQFDAHIAKTQATAVQQMAEQDANAGTEKENALAQQIAQTVEAINQVAQMVNALAVSQAEVERRISTQPRVKAVKAVRNDAGELMAVPEYEQAQENMVQ